MNPCQNIIAKRFKFNSCVRNANQSVSMFVAELRKLTEYCEYGESLYKWYVEGEISLWY